MGASLNQAKVDSAAASLSSVKDGIMALSLLIKQPTGVQVSYWKTTSMRIDVVNQTIAAEIGGYLDQNSHAIGNTPVTFINIQIADEDVFNTLLSTPNFIAAFHQYLSANDPNFVGSQVVP